MTGPSLGDAAQIRMIGEQIGAVVAEVAIDKYARSHPETVTKVEIPAPIKWAAAILSAIMTACAVAMAIWMVSTLNDLQLTVTRIDERQQRDTTGKEISELKARVTALEQYHRAPSD